MKVILKLLSLLLTFFVLFTTTSVLNLFARCRAVECLDSLGARGIWWAVLKTLVLFLGPYGAIQLWRVKESGRLIGMTLFAAASLNSFLAAARLVLYGSPASIWPSGLFAVLFLVGFLTLYSESAKAACSGEPR